MTKRGYSREFTPHGDTGKRYLLDNVPAGLWAAVRTKAKRDGISVRALILQLLAGWLEATDYLERRDAARVDTPASVAVKAAHARRVGAAFKAAQS